jgi:hypothetical protein
MNNHFEDAWYYGKRAGKHLSRGLREELAPVERRVRETLGWEREELSRRERLRKELKATEDEAAERARRVVRRARRRV